MDRTSMVAAARQSTGVGRLLPGGSGLARQRPLAAAGLGISCPLRSSCARTALPNGRGVALRPGAGLPEGLKWSMSRSRGRLVTVRAEDGSKSPGVKGDEKAGEVVQGGGKEVEKGKRAEEPLDRFVDEESKREMVWWRKIFLPLTWVVALLAKWPQWVARQKLAALREAAEAEPENVEKQLALLRELNKGINRRPLINHGDAKVEEVVEHMRSGKYAANNEVVIEYLRALVHTGAVNDYSENEAVRGSGVDHRSLTTLLEQLRTLSAGDKVDLAPGDSMRRPLHVVVEGSMLPPEGPFAVLRKLLAFAFFAFAAACIWLVGASIARKMAHSSSYPSAAPGFPGTSMSGGSSSHAPKEYNKDTMSEKSIKTFKDVYGCDEAKGELEEIVAYLKTPEKFTRLGGKLPKGILLTGPPGTGKTLLARAVAGEAGVPFFYRAGSEFEEMFVGVGSRRVRSLFSAAKNKAPCIVFIDEIDAIGGNRKQWESHTKKTLNQMLVEMDGFEANEGIIVMAATNLPETLDPALTRPGRFDRHVAVPLPDVKGRLEILKHYMEDKPISVQVDRQLLARNTPGFSGAKLANLVNEAALIAAKTNKDVITPAMLDEARDKIMMGVERKSLVQSLEARKLTAYHEGGHALVALKTQGANPIHKATIIPRGHALGMVTQVPDKDEFSITREQMLAYIDVCMGGKVAEELIFGEMKVTSGATQDLVQATRMARHMVADCGMSDLIGPMHVQTLMDHERSGGVLREHVDAEVARVLRESYERVKSMLTTNEQQLHTLAGALLEHETLTQKDIRDVLDGSFTSVPPEGPASSDSGAPKQEEEEEGVELEHIPAGAAASVITPSPPTSPVAA